MLHGFDSNKLIGCVVNTWSVCARKWLWPNLKVLLWRLLVLTEETHDNIDQDITCTG
jgi:hypothetical protein